MAKSKAVVDKKVAVTEPQVLAVPEVAVTEPPAGSKAEVALRIVSVGLAFNRAGLRFTQEPVEIRCSYLTAEQIFALKAEPNLLVTEVELRY